MKVGVLIFSCPHYPEFKRSLDVVASARAYVKQAVVLDNCYSINSPSW